MKRETFAIIVSTLFTLVFVSVLISAVACSLTDPDRDIKKLFPQSTGYKTDYVSIKDRGGEELAKAIEERLGDKLEPVYESIDLPYTIYTVLKGKEVVGYVHGVNQKGIFGLLQVILAIDTTGKILKFYYQKISSPEAKKFTAPSFCDQFKGLTLADFYTGSEKVSKIKDPSQNSHNDFLATMRAVKKNLIILDKFVLKDKYEEVYLKTKGGVRNEKK